MKLYHSLSEALKAIFVRHRRQVIAIVSFNGKAYFVQRSTLSAEKSFAMSIGDKLMIGNELARKFETPKSNNNGKLEKLTHYTAKAGVPTLFPPTDSLHAEENVIKNFNELIDEFTKLYPNEKINNVDITLTHSPCSDGSSLRNCSSSKRLNDLEMPAGCYEKLTCFFKRNFRNTHTNSFSENPKIRVRYCKLYDSSVSYENSTLVQPSDGVTKAIFTSRLGEF